MVSRTFDNTACLPTARFTTPQPSRSILVDGPVGPPSERVRARPSGDCGRGLRPDARDLRGEEESLGPFSVHVFRTALQSGE